MRLVGFFIATLVLFNLLRVVPVIGGLFHGLLGFWVTAILVAALASRLADVAVSRSKLKREINALGAVDRPHNQGKLGVLLSSHGRFARALPHLEQACAGEPEFAEWHYRRGLALLETKDTKGACAALERAEALAPDHAWGGVQIALARARLAERDFEHALAAIERFERERGPTPESSYWRGRILKGAGRSAEARAAFAEVGQIAAQTAKFHRKAQGAWVWRARLARLF